MKKKIGILTYHNVFNFGAYLQNLALINFLKENNFEVEVINYKSLNFSIKELRGLVSKNIIKSVFNLINFVLFFFYRRKIKKTNYFTNIRKINFSKYDLIIYGSDEIWNYKNPIVGYDQSYFGDHCKNKKISYATSFGNIQSLSEKKPQIKILLKKFKYISVRDINSFNLVKKNLNKNADIVLDPIFLHDFKFEDSNFLHDYLVIYGSHFSCHYKTIILKYAKKKKKKIVSLAYYHNWVDENYILISPMRFMNLIKNSNIIFTNMFHGVMFSIKFNKPFFLISDDYRRFKLDYIVKKFNLKVLSEQDNLNDIQNEINVVDQVKLNKMINESKKKLLDKINEVTRDF